jgi:hypothetical protein
MNPFVALLIIVPLLISLILTIAAAALLVEEGPSWGLVSAFGILFAISGALIFLLKRTSRSPSIEFPGDDRLDESTRRQLTTFFTSVIFVTLLLIGTFFVNIYSLRNWVGILSMVLALLMTCSSVLQFRRKRNRTLNELGEPNVREIKSREIFVAATTITSKLCPASLVLMGFSLVVLYWFLGADRYFSLLDLTGVLLLGGALWLWSASIRRG